jgi:UDP-N-acetylmuramoyl-L-alanyl-D-glutamate--2,6-diaminopimelate ligase
MYKIKSLVPQSMKNVYHLGQAIMANIIYGFPSQKINSHTNFILASLARFLHSHNIGVGVKVIGVTGTNGKTTTVQMIAKILEKAGFKVAVASTINFKINGEEWTNKTKFTTLSSFQAQSFIKKAVQNGCQYLVLETSSHSLDQYRVWGIAYQTAVITNVTREHLDYHQDMQQYRKAKSMLFKKVKVAIVNLDMEKPEDFLSFNNERKIGYSCQAEHSKAPEIIQAENIEFGIQNTKYKIQNTDFILNMLGLFNIENALAATAVGISENINMETIKKALEEMTGVPGRMEYVKNDRGLNIIIDYAVTPDSLQKLYALIKQINVQKSQIIAVFGACGERDRGKRPLMGKIVSEYADRIILTNEDPYGESPAQIINEVFSGVVGFEIKGEIPNFQFPISNFQSNPNDQVSNSKKIEGLNCWRILDRREAIRHALMLAKSGDFVVITGKGAEETMAIGQQRIPWNDKKVILEELQKL